MEEHTCENCVVVVHAGDKVIGRCDDCLEAWFIEQMKRYR